MEYAVVEYNEEMGKNPLTEEMKEVLKGLTVDEQLDYFAVDEVRDRSDYSYGEESGGRYSTHDCSLRKAMIPSEDKDVTGVVVHNGYIVGMLLYNSHSPVLLNKWVCTYYASEDDGTGHFELTVEERVVFVGKIQ